MKKSVFEKKTPFFRLFRPFLYTCKDRLRVAYMVQSGHPRKIDWRQFQVLRIKQQKDMEVFQKKKSTNFFFLNFGVNRQRRILTNSDYKKFLGKISVLRKIFSQGFSPKKGGLRKNNSPKKKLSLLFKGIFGRKILAKIVVF